LASTTQLDDCRRDEVSLDEVERILIAPFEGSNPRAPASQRGLGHDISPIWENLRHFRELGRNPRVSGERNFGIFGPRARFLPPQSLLAFFEFPFRHAEDQFDKGRRLVRSSI
jgi:hypothetical protein